MSTPTSIPAFLQNPTITGIVRSNDVPTNFLHDRWFPREAVNADEFEGLIILDQVDLARFVAVDAETPTLDGDITGQYKWEVAYIREKMRFKESDMRIFWEPGVSDPNTLAYGTAQAQEAKLMRSVDRLSTAVDARKEWLFANAIGGSISYNDVHVQYAVTYAGAYHGSNRKVPSTLWTSGSATIIADLSNWVEEIADESGIEDWVLIAPPRIIGLMARNTEVQRLWQNVGFVPAAQDPASLNQISGRQIAQALDIINISEIIRYTAKYTTRTESAGSVTRTKTRFIADTDVFLLPADRPLGRFASAPSKANNNQSGKFGWSKEMVDPWVVEVGAGEYTWPDWPGTLQNSVLQARVT